jgi:hypothetical protein
MKERLREKSPSGSCIEGILAPLSEKSLGMIILMSETELVQNRKLTRVIMLKAFRCLKKASHL